MSMSLVLRLPCDMHLCRSSSNVQCLPSFLEMLQTLTFCSLLTRCTCHAKRHLNVQEWSEHVMFLACWRARFRHLNFQKWVRNWCALYILTWKCASCHSGVHFSDISTSKSGPNMLCFVHFDLEMCFAPQWRALFRHHNFQKWSECEVFCTFSLANVLRAKRRATFHLSSGHMAPHPTDHWKNTVNRDFPTFSLPGSSFF